PDVFVGDRGDVAEALVGHTRRVFRVLARIDVGDDARHAPGVAFGCALIDATFGMQPFPAAVARRGAELGVVFRCLALERAYPGFARGCAVLGMDGGEEFEAARDARRFLAAEEAHPAVACGELVALDDVVPLGHVAAVERHLEAGLRLVQARFGAALLGDVAAHAAIADEAALRIVARLAGDDVYLPRAARIGAGDLEVEERQLLAQPPEVR